MALPVTTLPVLNFQQANPFLMGLGAAQDLYAKSVANQYAQPMAQQNLQQAQLNNQVLASQAKYADSNAGLSNAILQNMAQYAPLDSQAQLENWAATRGLQGAQANYYSANAGLTNTEIAKNNFLLNNPATLLPGVAGNIGAYAVLRQLLPGEFGQNKVAPPSATQVATTNLSNGGTTQIPGLPSAGTFTGDTGTSSTQILPPAGSIGSQQPPSQSVDVPQPFTNGIPYAQQNIPQNQGSVSQPVATGGLPNVQDFANIMMQQAMAPTLKNIAQTNYYNTRTGLAAFNSLTPDAKANILAEGRSAGLSPTQTINYVANGGDMGKLLQQLAQKGTPLPPTPSYYPSQKAINQSQISTAATAALTAINPTITDALAPYSRQFFGISPKLVMQELTGDDPDSQSKALAARAFSPEVVGVRLKALQMQNGIEALREVQDKSMINLGNYQSMVSPQVYKAAQGYIDTWVAQMSNAYNKALYNNTGQVNVPPPPASLNNSYNTPAGAANTVIVVGPSGNQVRIPKVNLSEAMKRGYKAV